MVVVDARGAVAADRWLYYGAKLLAQTAQNLLLAALFVVAGTSSAAALDLSSVFVAILGPAVILGPIGGAIADRLGPARGYFIGALLRLAPVTAAFFLLDGATWAWAIAFAYSAGSQVFTPSEMALVRTIQRRQPGRAHSFLVALQYGGQGLGMLVLAPALYLAGGLGAVLAGSMVGFIVLVAMTGFLALRLRATPAGDMQPSRQAFSFGQICRYFAREPRASYAVTVLAFKSIVSRVIVVALPAYLATDMRLGEEAVAYLFAPGVAGVGVALLWAGRSLTLDSARDVMRLSLMGMIVGVFALVSLDYGVHAIAQYSQLPPVARLEASINTTFAVALPVAFLLGVVLTSSLIAARVALTETAPHGQQSRVFAVQETITESLIVLPLLVVGIGTELTGARPMLAMVGALAMAAFVVLDLPVARRALGQGAREATAASSRLFG